MNKKMCPAHVSKPGNSTRIKEYYSISASQRAKILTWLQQGKTLTTFQARNDLDIPHPAGRVLELRYRGWNIKTHWEVVETSLGKHRIAKYLLVGGGNGDF
jgi:hypothetical protein